MLGLTTLGFIHTLISLVALGAGLLAVLRSGAIAPASLLGRIYIGGTVLSCLTGFGIFQHGGFGKPHALGIMTLLVLAFALLAPRIAALGRFAERAQTLGLSLTLFFHFVPGITETFTRLPLGRPLFSSPEDPALAKVIGVVFLLYLIGATLQWRRLSKAEAQAS